MNQKCAITRLNWCYASKSAVVGTLAWLASTVLVSASVVTMTAVDASGTSSLSGAGKWDNLAAPSAANDYFSSVYYIRTPGTNVTFAGKSLTLQTPAAAGVSGQVAPVRSIIYKGTNTGLVTINTLTNAGGIINAGSGNVLGIFNGSAMYVVSNSTIQADQGSFQLGWALYGSADLTNTSGSGKTITYTNNNSGFTGRFVINNNVTVAFNSPMGAPGNPTVATPGQIDLGAGCTLLDNAGISLTNLNGGITLEGNAILIAASNTMTISEPVTDNGSGFNLIKQGGGILTLSGNNIFSGGLSLSGLTAGSQLNINSATALGSGTFSIYNGNNAVLDNTTGAALTLANNNAQVWSNNFVFIGSKSLNFGTGLVTLGAGVVVSVSSNNLTAGDVTDNGFAFGLTKAGPGTLTVGDTFYSGPTLVSNGTLVVKSLASSTSITLATSTAILNVAGGLAMAGNQTLGGSGTVTGGVTDNSGVLILPGGNATGTLTVNGNLSLNGGATLAFNLSTNTTPGGGTNDLVVVTGTLNIAGATTINLIGVPSTGTYTLLRYGTFAGSLANLSAPNGYALVNNTSAKTIELQATHVPVSLVWVGDGANNFWDTDVTFNWVSGAVSSAFFAGDSVTFNDSGSTSPAINIVGPVSPAVTTVNATGNFDFTGGAIANGSLVKANTGTLILENNNTYAGATVISGGTVQVGTGGTTGALGTGLVTNNASLVYNRSDAVTLPAPLYGTGTLTMAGSGTLIASGSNYFSGSTLINSGTIDLTNAAGLGTAAGGIVVSSGGELLLSGNVDIDAKALTLNGSGVTGVGALHKGGVGTTTYYGAVTLGSDATLGVDAGLTLNLTNGTGVNGAIANANLTLAGVGTGNITGPLSLGSGNLTVSGGTWTVAPSNHFSAVTAINAGTLLLTGSGSLGQLPVFNASAVSLSGGGLGTATNVTLNDGKIGITLSASASLAVNGTNATLSISNKISGDSSLILTKTGNGRLILNGANDFGGTLNVDTLSTSASDGMTVIANSAAIANIQAVAGSPYINIRNNNSGSSTLALDGTAGNIAVAPDIGLSGRNVAVPAIENLSGNNTISGNITVNVGGIYYIFQSDAGNLTLAAAAWPYATPTSSARSFTFQGAGNISVTGVIQDGSNNGTSNIWINLIKAGTGGLTLSAANTYSGSTTISNGVLSLTGSIGSGGVTVAGGLLVGTGTIAGPVAVAAGAAIEAGTTNTIGTLTVSASPITLAGNTVAKINKNAGTSDLISGQSSVTYGGTLTVTNLAGTLAAGDSFTLFSPGASASNFASIIGSPGAGLSYRFTNGVLSVVSGLVNLTVSVSGNTLSIAWPATHLGWILQTQTNALNTGLSTNWTDLSTTASVTVTNITINPTNPSVFFRLRQPSGQ